MFTARSLPSAVSFAAILLFSCSSLAGEVNVYSARQPFLIEPMLKAFTDKTGIRVNTVFDKKSIEERLKAEGPGSPADLVLTVDIGRLNDLVVAGVAQPVLTDTLKDNIPEQYHAPDGAWWALTSRARVLYVSKDRVQPGEISSYAELADPKWKGRICTRPGDSDYHVALTAAMIAHKGIDATRNWLNGLKANLARKPQGNDRSQVKAVKEGVCDIAIGNTYYMAAMMKDPEQRAWAEAVRIVFPDQKGNGTHVNVSGMVLTKSAPNRENAIQLMEFLSSDEAQRMYAEINNEYPVKPGVEWSATVRAWGDFKVDIVRLAEVAGYRTDALKLINEVDFNAGA
ncbi:Fe(3+) ABC transporter substrate-binding protein [Haematospirillum jordaniae]|uniref:Fe(3+) ABC transporter substrate-binding protein n=1 Tax=Haematospirillum jordaniae TaxID=1549855 RepID=UPI0014331F43|nr:Fe(3+) ABC transporter substrate-binding protein [Haematospirillum jordaniae]NKD84969.1 Fe(3+) ABC transporter substrate-binding protein [Haematospirillum jordaniae]